MCSLRVVFNFNLTEYEVLLLGFYEKCLMVVRRNRVLMVKILWKYILSG